MTAEWDALRTLAKVEVGAAVAAQAYDLLGLVFGDLKRANAPPAPLSEAEACEETVHVAQFWRRMRFWHHVQALLVVGGLFLATISIENGVEVRAQGGAVLLAYLLLLPMALRALAPRFRGASRWRAICCIFSVSFFMSLGELFRYAFGAPFSTKDWAQLANFALLFCLSGSLPGQPARIATSGGALALTLEDTEPEDGEALPSTVPVAETMSIANSPLGQLFFVHFLRLVRATQRHGFLRAIDVPIMGHAMQAESLSVKARILLHRFLPAASAALYQDESPRAALAEAPARIGLWSRETRGLMAVLFLANTGYFLMMFTLTIVSVLFYYAPSFFANRIFTVLETEEKLVELPVDTLKRALPWVLGLFLTVIVSSTVQGQLWSILEAQLNVRITTQLSTLLYDKTLNRRNETRANEEGPSSSSQVLTLHLVDLKRVTTMLFDLFMLTNVPFELALGGYFAYRILGVSAIVGLASTLILIPLISIVSKRFSHANEQLMAARDKRMGLLNECFLGIRMIKSQAWERRFDERIQKPRTEELNQQRWTFVLESCLSIILEVNPLLVTVVALSYYTLVLHETLTPKIAFTSLAVFSELRWTLTMLPSSLTNIMQAMVSLRRICEFLLRDQVAPSPTGGADEPPKDAPRPTVAFEKATVSWPAEAGAANVFALHDLSVDFAPGRNLICGRVGAGKSLLLHALLHEAEVRSGKVVCPRSPFDGIPFDAATREAALDALNTDRWLRPDLVAFAPQTPYLMNTTLRENILFGLPLGNAKRYQAVLEACSLRGDLQQLEHGDMTDVGENGTELSGGQKARVALARAVYSRASILLLDDVLSAVDAHTAKHLAERLLAGPLIEGRTLLLVSHNVQLVGPQMDKVVYLEDRRIAFDGSGPAFLNSTHFNGLLEAKDEDEEPSEKQPEDAKLSEHGGKSRAHEHRERGSIAWRVWEAYVQASSGWSLCIVTMLLFAASSLWDLVNNAWLRDWSATIGKSTHASAWWLSWYVVLVVTGILFGVLRWVGIYTMSLLASRRLFDKMLWRTLRAPLRFHDMMTRGRLLNRFGQDLEVLDSKFARAIADVVIRVTQLLTTCIALYIVSGWRFVLALLLLTPLYTTLSKWYIATARDLQRLTSTSRTLVVNSFGNAVHGVTVLRAFGAQQRFTNEMYAVLDNNNRYIWWTNQGSRWISQMFNLISSVLVLGSCLMILLEQDVDAPAADFSITFLIDLNFNILILMRMYTIFQTSGVAVERVFEFADTIDQEAAEICEPRPSADWPEHGKIVVRDLCMRYAPGLPDVLRHVSFEVRPGTKLAVVGPTGSGKSTLANAFLRFVESHEGSITIDGVDIAQVGLTDLRSRLQIVPQDPVILSGTLRSVLDVLGEFTDEQLLEALRTVHLVDGPSSQFANLDFSIAESGTNLSQGQRQLLCLARAILRRSRVVLFDEASSSIDYDTDMRITEVIHEAFCDSSVLTIAHRLRSVIAYDQVLFLDRGSAVEIGEPHVLLQNKQSRFFQLCQSAGPAELAYLLDAAGAARKKRAQN